MFGFREKKKIVKQKNIQSILIANRGEIAYRIIKTAKKMGIKTIIIYSQEDKKSLFIQKADKAIFIEDENPRNVYLDGNRIASIAKKNKKDVKQHNNNVLYQKCLNELQKLPIYLDKGYIAEY